MTQLAPSQKNAVKPPFFAPFLIFDSQSMPSTTKKLGGRMIQEGAFQFAEARLKEYLRPIIGKFDIGNGTSAADAAAVALAIDLRLSSAGSNGLQRLLSLSRSEFVDVLCSLLGALRTPGTEFELPLGAPVTSREPGGIRIGKEWWVLDADAAGLFPMETTRWEADGRNLALLHREIRRLTRNLACRRMGLPQAKHIVINDSRHILQFPPFAEAGCVALQRATGGIGAPHFCSALPLQIHEFAADIVKDMRMLWKRRRDVAARAERVRANAHAEAAAEPGTAVQMVAIDLSGQTETDGLCMYVEYTGTDEALRPGVLLDYVPSNDDLSSDYRRRRGPIYHGFHKEDAAELAEKGANGRINDLARAIVAVVPGGAPAMLARMGSELEVIVAIPTKGAPLYATLFWKGGVIEGEVTIPGHLDSFGDRVEVYGARYRRRLSSIFLGEGSATSSRRPSLGRHRSSKLARSIRDCGSSWSRVSNWLILLPAGSGPSEVARGGCPTAPGSSHPPRSGNLSRFWTCTGLIVAWLAHSVSAFGVLGADKFGAIARSQLATRRSLHTAHAGMVRAYDQWSVIPV